MRLLFLLYDFYPNFNANSIIISNLAQAFKDSGHEIHVLTMRASSDLKNDEVWNGIFIHRNIKTYDKHQVIKYIRSLRWLSALRLTISILRNRLRKKEYLSSYWYFHSVSRLHSLMKAYPMDILINVCYPFEACLPVMKYMKRRKKKFHWIIYMQDPFAENYYYLSKYAKEELQAFQSKIFEMADKIIITPQSLEDGLGADQSSLSGKFKVLNLPKVMKLFIADAADDITFHHHYINCVYVGKFNRNTRNPRRLFQLFEGLAKKRIILHIIGEERSSWEDCLSGQYENILFHGTKSKEACMNAELRANLLVNLGNSMRNQMPSKLLEYISTGKPIINLYQIPECPSLMLMDRYPISLSIYEKQIGQNRIYSILQYFCYRNHNVHISYFYIRERFYYYTVDYVSSEFLNLFDELSEDDP